MKILLSCHQAEVGGIQTWMVGLARSLRVHGHDCELFFFRGGAFEAHIPTGLPFHRGDLAHLLRLVHTNRYDVVHACNTDWEDGLAAVRHLGAKLVLTCHGWVCPCWSSRTCDALIACSRWNAVSQQEPSDLPVRLVYNGIDTDFYSPPTNRADGPPIVAWVGRGGALEQKRIDRLAAIAGRVVAGGVRLWVADPDGAARVPEAVATALRSSAAFWGPVEPTKMRIFYQQVAASGGCVLSTSTFEGLPLALAEAQACGCAVIGPDVRGVNEAVDPTRGGVIYPPDLPADGLARLVLQTLSDRESMAARGRASRRFAVERFGHTRMVGEYLAAYQSVLATPRRMLRRPAGGFFRSFVRFRSPHYIAHYWAAGHSQFVAAEKLLESGDRLVAKAAVAASLLTCPTLFLRPRRLSHLVAAWRGCHLHRSIK
ncbi:MAG: family glycosyltransferase [Gemmataceae bacterium]|nr:family glycosyltransferase [Gemmataceae bacterium]